MIQRGAALFLVVLAMVVYWPAQAAAQAASKPQTGDIVDDPDLDLVPLHWTRPPGRGRDARRPGDSRWAFGWKCGGPSKRSRSPPSAIR